MICALDRVEAHVAARKLAAVAEFIRRRPARDDDPRDSARSRPPGPGKASAQGPPQAGTAAPDSGRGRRGRGPGEEHCEEFIPGHADASAGGPGKGGAAGGPEKGTPRSSSRGAGTAASQDGGKGAPQDPAKDGAAEVAGGMPPQGWDEFAVRELAWALAESQDAAGDLMAMAYQLEARLPGTRAALREGRIRLSKATAIATATQFLDAEEAAAAEGMVLGRAGQLTPPGLRAAIGRAVMEVAPKKARKRREEAARQTRVERWAEHSGNAGLAGRELPSAQVLAAISGSPRGRGSCGRPGWTATWTCCGPALSWTFCWAWTPGSPLRAARPGRAAQRTAASPARPVRLAGGRPDPFGPSDRGPFGPVRWPGRRRVGPVRAAGSAGRGGAAAGVLREHQPDRPAGHRAGPGRPARAGRRAGPGRPVAGPRPGPLRRRQPQDHLVRHGDRRGRPRHRPRLRPPGTPNTHAAPRRTRRSRPARRPRRARPGRGPTSPATRTIRPGTPDGARCGPRFSFTAAGQHRPARRVRHLAAVHRDTRAAGPDHRRAPDRRRGLRSPVPGGRPRPGGHAAAPVPDPARQVHRPGLPETRLQLRLRTQCPLRGRRQNLPV